MDLFIAICVVLIFFGLLALAASCAVAVYDYRQRKELRRQIGGITRCHRVK